MPPHPPKQQQKERRWHPLSRDLFVHRRNQWFHRIRHSTHLMRRLRKACEQGKVQAAMKCANQMTYSYIGGCNYYRDIRRVLFMLDKDGGCSAFECALQNGHERTAMILFGIIILGGARKVLGQNSVTITRQTSLSLDEWWVLTANDTGTCGRDHDEKIRLVGTSDNFFLKKFTLDEIFAMCKETLGAAETGTFINEKYRIWRNFSPEPLFKEGERFVPSKTRGTRRKKQRRFAALQFEDISETEELMSLARDLDMCDKVVHNNSNDDKACESGNLSEKDEHDWVHYFPHSDLSCPSSSSSADGECGQEHAALVVADWERNIIIEDGWEVVPESLSSCRSFESAQDTRSKPSDDSYA